MQPGRKSRLDRAQVRHLLSTWILLDFFGASRRRGEAAGSSLTTTLFTQSSLSLLFAALLFPETPPVRFSAATLSLSAGLSALSALAEFQDSGAGAADRAVVETAPVSRLTLGVARALRVLFFLCLVTLALAIPPGVLSYWIGGRSLAYAAAYFAGALLASALAAGVLSLILGAAERLAGQDKALAVASSLRALLFAGGFVALALGFRTLSHGPESFPGGIAVLRLAPTYWIALCLEPAAGRAPPPAVFPLLLAGLCIAVVAGLAALSRLEPREKPGRRIGSARLPAVARLLAPEAAERAAFGFTRSMLLRERQFRVRALPLLVLPFAMGFLGLVSEEAGGSEPLFAVVQQLPAIYLPFLVAFLPASESWEGRWVFFTSPVRSMAPIRRGAAMAVLAVLALPVLLLLLAVHAFLFGVARGILTSVFSAGILLLLLPGAFRRSEGPPFSTSPDLLGAGPDLGGLFARGIALTGAAVLFALLLDRPAVAAAIAAATLGAGVLRCRGTAAFGEDPLR